MNDRNDQGYPGAPKLDERRLELLIAISEAEERGAWPLAAQLRRRSGREAPVPEAPQR